MELDLGHPELFTDPIHLLAIHINERLLTKSEDVYPRYLIVEQAKYLQNTYPLSLNHGRNGDNGRAAPREAAQPNDQLIIRRPMPPGKTLGGRSIPAYHDASHH
jgi:hypothetical protein